MSEKYILCDGLNCPLKSDCKRFKRDIDKKKEEHWAYPPFKDGKCSHFDPKDDIDKLFDKIKTICD